MKLGLAYRPEFKADWEWIAQEIDTVEIMPEWYENAPNHTLEELREMFRGLEIRAHALTLNLGSTRKTDLGSLRRVLDSLKIEVISDHFSFMSTERVQLGNFLPPVLTSTGLELLAENLSSASKRLERRVEIENIVYFTPWPDYVNSESKALSDLASAGGGLLLDVNNLYVNSVNHDFDPYAYIDQVAPAVRQIHVAGHAQARGHLVDSHMDPISPKVFDLLRYASQRTPASAVILERDNSSATTDEILSELRAIRSTIDKLSNGRQIDCHNRAVSDFGFDLQASAPTR